MKKGKIPRLMISAAGSSSGKTTVMLALAAALRSEGKKVQCFKTGPDYIDPMFHELASGREAFHADAFFCDSSMINSIIGTAAEDADISLIEGAMGYYDGTGKTSEASAYTVSRITETPVILVISPQGMGVSCAAMLKGYTDFREESNIRGVILNRIKPGMFGYYRDIIENETSLKVAGWLPELKSSELKSRHLGLVTASETENISDIITELGEQARKTIDLDMLFSLADTAPDIDYAPVFGKCSSEFRIAVARDRAFCFYYNENLKMLESEGAELVFFSPLEDSSLPENISGLYIGGGYPELYTEKLSKNREMISSVRSAVSEGMPVIAECGGFMYLLQGIYDTEGRFSEMCGILDGTAELKDRLCRFGYITLTAEADSVLCSAGTELKAHEFHYSDSTCCGDSFTARKPDGREWKAIVSRGNIAAGYPHIYFPSCPEAPAHFCSKCRDFFKKELRCNNI